MGPGETKEEKSRGIDTLFNFIRFDRSLGQQVDRIVFGSQTMQESLEKMVLQQISQMKAQEIYGNCGASVVEPEVPVSPAMKLRSGDDLAAEEQANEMLVSSRRAEGKFADRREWLTTEQIMLRQHKEVYNQNGFPDISLVSGMYRRAYNPNAGHRPGKHKSEEQ